MAASSALGITLVVFLAMLATALAFSGDATYFNVGLGACGHHNNNNQLVAALVRPPLYSRGRSSPPSSRLLMEQ
jgi:hypothetical protein